MKNQYVGDIGDYGKYSLLRDFINAGVKIGVNWYLTENDDTNDGKFTDYLENKDEYRRYDPELFDVLKRVGLIIVTLKKWSSTNQIEVTSDIRIYLTSLTLQ